jgi:hypothetical protein
VNVGSVSGHHGGVILCRLLRALLPTPETRWPERRKVGLCSTCGGEVVLDPTTGEGACDLGCSRITLDRPSRVRAERLGLPSVSERVFTCRECGERCLSTRRVGRLPTYCQRCRPDAVSRRDAQRATREERDHLRAEVEALRATGGIGVSERRLLALASDLLAAYAASAQGHPFPTDDEIAELTIAAIRSGDGSRARGLCVAVAGAWLARAQAISEITSARNAESARTRAA